MINLKRLLIFYGVVIISVNTLYAQREKLYNPDADAMTQFAEAMSKAMNEKKHVLVQIGGNWCKWCYRFHDFIKSNPELDSLINADYVTVHINYSKENKNLPLLETFGFPQRFGFPVFLIFNINGDRIHTQSSWFLEDGKESYDAEKVKAFLKDWNMESLNPENYKDK